MARAAARWDVVIVGAGPAGCAAALGALRAKPDARVLLIDSAAFPRDKVCGDGIAPQALDVLADLGVDPDALVAGSAPISRLRLYSPGGAVAARTTFRTGFVVPRTVFDERLVRAAVAAGAVLRRHTVRSLSVDEDEVVLDDGTRAAIVIGADGAESTVRRTITVRPTNKVRPAAAVRPAATGRSTTGARPTNDVRSTTSVRPTNEVRSATSVRPTTSDPAPNVVRPGSDVRSTNDVRPMNGVRPTNDDRSANGDRSASAVRSTNAVRSASGVRSSIDVRPTSGVRPASAVRSANGVRLLGERRSGRAGTVALAIRGYAPADHWPSNEQLLRMTVTNWPAYAWVFPIGDGRANVGYGEILRDAPLTRAHLEQRLHALLPDAQPTNLRAHRLPLSTGRPSFAHGRVLLVGDAAALINPLTGEGIFYAVASGALAGAAAVGPDPGRSYSAALHARLGRHLRHTDLAALLTGTPRMIDAAVAAAGRDQGVFDSFVDLGLGDGLLGARSLMRTARHLVRPWSGWGSS